MVFAATPCLRPHEHNTTNTQTGDMLIIGSHGLFDMVWLHGGPSTNLRRELFTLSYAGAADTQTVSKQLVGLANNMATGKTIK